MQYRYAVWAAAQQPTQACNLKRSLLSRLLDVEHIWFLLRGLQAAESVHNFALSLNEEAMLLAFDDYQSLLKRYARIPDWQKPLPNSFKPGIALISSESSKLFPFESRGRSSIIRNAPDFLI